MKQKLIFRINDKEYEKDKYSFQNDEFMININDVDIERIVLSNKTPYGKKGANKYYVGYLSGSFRPLNIVVKDTELCADSMHVLTNRPKFLKYVEIWNKTEALFNKITSKNFRCNTEYIKAKISPYNENSHDINKRLKRGNYYGALVLLIDSICEVKSSLYPQTLLKKLFECNNKNNTFKEPPQIVDESSDESSDKSSDESSDECIYELSYKSTINNKALCTFFSCSFETRCKYFFRIIDFLKNLISSIDIPELVSSNTSLTIAAIFSCLKNLSLLVS